MSRHVGRGMGNDAVVDEITYEQIISDGRRLDVVSAGPRDGAGFVLHGGTPIAAVPFRPAVDAALSRGLRYISYSRPGYAGSDAQPGRTVADAATDVSAILDQLGVDSFVTVGWSGGGPHALACAALLPKRCAAAATLAGVAPSDAEDLGWTGWLDGMDEENQAEFTAARAGDPALSDWLDAAALALAGVTAHQVAAAFGGLVSDVDRASLTGDFAEWTAAAVRKALSTGIAGWHDDDLAFVSPWGFDLATIDRPVFVWQGSEDRMVPYAHGGWLAAHVPGARPRLLPGEGHLSIAMGAIDRIAGELASELTGGHDLR